MLHKFIVKIDDWDEIEYTDITVEDDDPDYDDLDYSDGYGVYHVMASTKEGAIEEAKHLRDLGY